MLNKIKNSINISLVKDSAIYLLGELFSKSIPFLLLPYLSRKLGVAGYGELSYYQTYLALFAIFIGLNQEGAVARYYYFYGKKGIDLILMSGYIYTCITGLLLLLFCFFLKSYILCYIVGICIFSSFLASQLSVRQCQKQAIPYTVLQFLSGFISAVFTVIFLEIYTNNLVEKRFLALLVANIVVFVIAFLLYHKKNKGFRLFTLKKYKLGIVYILSFGLPLILHQLSFFMKGQLDRIFIYQTYSAAQLGVYSAAIQFASIISILIMAINKATLPYYYEALQTNKWTLESIKKITVLSLLLTPLPAVVLYVLPESLLLWILGKDFVGVKYYTCLFLFGYSLTIPYLILVNYLFYYGKNGGIAKMNLMSAFGYVALLIYCSQQSITWVPFALILSNLLLVGLLWMTITKENSKNVV